MMPVLPMNEMAKVEERLGPGRPSGQMSGSQLEEFWGHRFSISSGAAIWQAGGREDCDCVSIVEAEIVYRQMPLPDYPEENSSEMWHDLHSCDLTVTIQRIEGR